MGTKLVVSLGDKKKQQTIKIPVLKSVGNVTAKLTLRKGKQ